MEHTMDPWMRRLLLACTIVLGVQLSFPLSLQASIRANQQVDVVSLGTKDPSNKPGIHVDFDLLPIPALLILVPEWLEVLAADQPGAEDADVSELLPVTGFHPSAP